MKYKKYNLNKFNLHIIKTEKFKTITLKIVFKREVKKEDLTIRRVLTDILLESSMKYPSRRLIEMETEELYGLELYGNNYVSGNYDVMNFTSSFLNEKYTESNMNKRSIMFILNLLLNPDIKNNEFNEYGFDLAYRIIENDIKTFGDYPNSYSTKRMLEVMDKKSSISYRNCGYLNDLKKITKKNLYEYYKSVIENDIVDIFVVGDVEENKILKVFEDNFNRINNNRKSGEHFIKVQSKKTKEKIEKAKINQSHLVIGCNVGNVENLNYVLNVYSFILGGSGDSLLFQTVREKNSLCYNISSSYSIISNMLIIKAGIDSKNYKKTVDLIKQCMDKIKNGEFEQDDIDKAKIIYKNSCIEMLDSPRNIIDNYLSHEYLNTDLMDDRIKKIDNVTKEDIINLSNTIKINTIYMLEGEDNA